MSNLLVSEYFYVINCPIIEQSLCRMEMKYLFDKQITEKFFFSEKKISPSRSPYIKHRISVLFSADSLDDLMNTLQKNKTAYSDFKFAYFKIEGSDLSYEEWISFVTKLGTVIDGEVDMENPKIMLGATKINGRWIFGEYEKNDNKWKEHDKKPNTNSHSLSLKTAKALVNIAVGTNTKCTLVDPCCGVGTVVIEAISMGINVRGFDINKYAVENAKGNLAFFGYPDVIVKGDMHNIAEHFDVAILDIPYGLFTPVIPGEQNALIKTARRITDKMVIITFEDMENIIVNAGFTIVDRCHVTKGKFKRYISVCV